MSLLSRLSFYLSGYEKGYDDSHAIRYLEKREPELWSAIVEATSYLESPMAKQRCWHILNETTDIPVCPYSGDPVDWQGSRYRAFNGKGSNNRDPVEQNRRKKLFMARYGVENPGQAKECRSKQEATNLSRYGHTNFLASNDGIEAVKAAWADPEKKAKRLKSIHDAFMDKFGGYPYQDSEIFKKAMKNGFKYRSYTMPSGRTVQIQGYEDIALDELLREGIGEDDLRTDKSDVPVIWYDFECRSRRYYPDIHIVSQNRIIEVKSTFSYKYEEAKNEAKKKACEAAGFLFEFRIYASRSK